MLATYIAILKRVAKRIGGRADREASYGKSARCYAAAIACYAANYGHSAAG